MEPVTHSQALGRSQEITAIKQPGQNLSHRIASSFAFMMITVLVSQISSTRSIRGLLHECCHGCFQPEATDMIVCKYQGTTWGMTPTGAIMTMGVGEDRGKVKTTSCPQLQGTAARPRVLCAIATMLRADNSSTSFVKPQTPAMTHSFGPALACGLSGYNLESKTRPKFLAVRV